MKAGFVCLAAVAVVLTTLAAAPVQSPSARADGIIDAYEIRDYDGLTALIRGEKSASKLAKAFQTRADAWVNEAPPAQAPFRRRVAASAAIEIVAARMDPDWYDVRDLLEWACRTMRQSAQSAEWERAWLLGSIALAERAHDYAMLLGEPVTESAPALPISDPNGISMLQRLGVIEEGDQPDGYLHLAHAIARFPDEPRFELAQIVMSDPQWVDRPAAAGWVSDDALKSAAAQPGLDAAHAEIARRHWLQTVATSYVALAGKAPALAAECRVRAGVAYWRLHEFDAAAAQFRRVTNGEPFWRSLAAYWRGDLAERGADADAAMGFYRDALDADSGARAAASRLGALLFLAGRRADAEDVLSQSLRARGPDPWRELAYGDFRHWPDYQRALRVETPR